MNIVCKKIKKIASKIKIKIVCKKDKDNINSVYKKQIK